METMSCNTEGLINFFVFRLRQRKYLTVVLSLHHPASWFTSVSIHIAKIDVNRSAGLYSFKYDAIKLENVKSYKYLGLMLSRYGNFNHARQELKKNALKAQIAVFTLEKDYPSKTYV